MQPIVLHVEDGFNKDVHAVVLNYELILFGKDKVTHHHLTYAV